MSGSAHWNAMYEKPPEEIPWEIETAPRDLSDLVENKIVLPGRALDLGCGTGHYSMYLAEHGFDVTGVDFSENALASARKEAAKRALAITFLQGDVRGLTAMFPEPFDFILEYSLLHHISPDDLPPYTA